MAARAFVRAGGLAAPLEKRQALGELRLQRRLARRFARRVQRLSRGFLEGVAARGWLAPRAHVREPLAFRERPRARGVPPLSGFRVQAVERQEAPAVVRHRVHRRQRVRDLRRRREVRQTQSREPRPHHLGLVQKQRLQSRRARGVQPEQAQRVRSRARAPAARLHAEHVVQHRAHEAVVQEPALSERIRGRADQERDDRKPLIHQTTRVCFHRKGPINLVSFVSQSEHGDVRVGGQRGVHRLAQRSLRACNRRRADARLGLERQTGSDRAHDVLCAALLALVPGAEVALVLLRHEKHRAAARLGGHLVREQRALRDEHARRARAAR